MKKTSLAAVVITTLLLTGCSDEKAEQEKPVEAVTESQEESDAVVTAVKKAEGSVVGVSNIQQQQNGLTIENVQAGTGSGVIYKKEGENVLIMTNQHVVNGAQEVEITLIDEEKRTAEIVGVDPYTDLAVLRMNGEGIEEIADLGNSANLEKGETVIAIGNPLGLDFFGSVTKGIISATERVVPVDINKDGVQDWQVDVLQTDTAINPGNSGGALVNLNGEVVGINSMKISQETVEGIAFVIPMDTALPVLDELEINGEIKRPKLGVGMIDLKEVPGNYKEEYLKLARDETEGAVVMQVTPAATQFQQFDVITEVDGQKVTGVLSLREILFEKEIGQEVTVSLLRQGQPVEVQATLKE